MTDAAERRPAKSWSEARTSRFIAASMFAGKPRTLTITAADVTEVEGDDGAVEPALVVSFAETPKEWRVNVTNSQCLEALFGADPQASVGHRVTLYPVRTKFGSADVDGIRVWGSPEIESDRVVEVKLPRKRAQRVTLHAVRAKAAPPTTAREPGEDDK